MRDFVHFENLGSAFVEKINVVFPCPRRTREAVPQTRGTLSFSHVEVPSEGSSNNGRAAGVPFPRLPLLTMEKASGYPGDGGKSEYIIRSRRPGDTISPSPNRVSQSVSQEGR